MSRSPSAARIAVAAATLAALAVLAACGNGQAPIPTIPPLGSATPAAPTPTRAPGPTDGPGVVAIASNFVQFDRNALTVAADTPFTLIFTNNDAGIPHQITIHLQSPTGPEVWRAGSFNGVATRAYQVPALPAGTYGFACAIHPTMTGTLTVH